MDPITTTDPDWLAKFVQAYGYREQWGVYLDGKDWAIVKRAGHHYWSGLGQPWRWAPVSYYLADKAIGHHEPVLWVLHEGRLTREAKAMLVTELRRQEAT